VAHPCLFTAASAAQLVLPKLALCRVVGGNAESERGLAFLVDVLDDPPVVMERGGAQQDGI
jgi:hypothetical protein